MAATSLSNGSKPISPGTLILLGGGHSHLGVLGYLAGLHSGAARPHRIILVSEAAASAYSGMLPGVLSGHYGQQEMMIPLAPLAEQAGVEFIQSRVTALDLERQSLRLSNGQSLSCALLSINTGSTPDLSRIPGALEHALPVKPIPRFLLEMENLSLNPASIIIVGGGAAGVEIALGLHRRFHQRGAHFTLVSSGSRLLQGMPAKAGSMAGKAIASRGIRLELNRRVEEIRADSVLLDDGRTLQSDQVVVATGASAPDWLLHSGLALSERGFLQVEQTLQSCSHPWVFAAGDIADVRHFPRPKSGVYAVRQGPILAHNLLAAMEGKPMQVHQPQANGLALISTADGRAIACKGRFALGGRWAWWLKHRIDTRFMNTYR